MQLTDNRSMAVSRLAKLLGFIRFAIHSDNNIKSLGCDINKCYLKVLLTTKCDLHHGKVYPSHLSDCPASRSHFVASPTYS